MNLHLFFCASGFLHKLQMLFCVDEILLRYMSFNLASVHVTSWSNDTYNRVFLLHMSWKL